MLNWQRNANKTTYEHYKKLDKEAIAIPLNINGDCLFSLMATKYWQMEGYCTYFAGA